MSLLQRERPPAILIISRDHQVTAALQASLAIAKGLRHLSACVSSVDQALAATAAHRPDVILLDFGDTEREGLTQLARLRLARPEVPVIMVSTRGDEQWVVHAIQAGAADYLPVSDPNQLLGRAVGMAIRKVHAQEDLGRLSSDLVGIVSHDVRGPAANIISFSDLLLEYQPAFSLPGRERRMVERIRTNALFILTLTRDLLDTVRIDSGSLELSLGRTDVGLLIGESMERCSILEDINRVRLHSTCTPGTTFAVLDKLKMLQVLNNLVSNALKFSPAGSEVTIAARETDRHVIIQVSDQGQGIPSEETEKLFKKFSLTSTRPPRGEPGTGLGLFIVSEFVKLHEGTIGVESKPGVGSTFTVTLPRNGPRPVREEALSRPSAWGYAMSSGVVLG